MKTFLALCSLLFALSSFSQTINGRLPDITAISPVATLPVTTDNGLNDSKISLANLFASGRVIQGALTIAGTNTLDFNAATTVNSLTITGNVIFATANLAANRTYRLKITGTSTNAVPTFPAWKFIGAAAPTNITAAKISMLTLEAWGTTDATVVATFAEQP
jgi:hypothetical protein